MMKNVDVGNRPYKVTLTRLHVKAIAVSKNMHDSLDYFEPGVGCIKKLLKLTMISSSGDQSKPSI